jgi:hypothetical protein
VYRAVLEFPSGASAVDLRDVLPTMPKVGNRLAALVKQGHLQKDGRGVYRLP